MWLMTANSVHGRAENQTQIAVFTTHDAAMAYANDSRLPVGEKVDGFNLTFRDGSLLRWFNGYSIGDWHAPESSFGGWCSNPCLFDVQLHELHSDVTPGMVTAQGLPLDPKLPVPAAVSPSETGGSETGGNR